MKAPHLYEVRFTLVRHPTEQPGPRCARVHAFNVPGAIAEATETYDPSTTTARGFEVVRIDPATVYIDRTTDLLPMGPAELARAMELLNWTKAQLAAAINRNRNIINRWQDGTAKIPPAAAAWIARLAEFHRSAPPPAFGRKRQKATDQA